MSLFDRNLARYGLDVIIESRSTDFKNGQASETFVTFADPVKALIATVSGVSVFDDTNTERVATHRICIAYIAGVTAEKWVKFGSKRIKILTVENYCERDEQLILMCTERGDESKVVNEG